MNRITPLRPAVVGFALAAALALSFAATAFAVQYPSNGGYASPIANSAVLETRVFNDCPTSNLTTVNNYPALISFDDANVDCFGFANLHDWTLSTDGTNPANFENGSAYRLGFDFKIEGTGNGEGGLRISPWYSQYADGLFNVRSTDGEIACFGGRLPFFSFTGAFGLHYVKGDVIHLAVIYDPHGLSSGPPHSPATIEYRVSYQGHDYTSGKLAFDQGNETEDANFGTGQYGELNGSTSQPGSATRVGGHFKAFLGQGTPVECKATFSNIVFGTTPDVNAATVHERVFNDCPTSTLTTTNNYPALISFDDANVDCFGFANLHTWHFSEDGGATDAVFNNPSSFREETDFQIDGDGNGEGGILVNPWYSHDADGLFNVRSTDGEIACFGGRLPFYTFTGAFGLHYAKGNPIHLAVIYDAHSRTAADPATIEYQVSYLGTDYSSGPLPFDQGNTSEDALYGYGSYGMLNDGGAGGHFKAFLGQGTPVECKATFSNIKFSTCLHPADVTFDVHPHDINTKEKGPKWVTAVIKVTPPALASDIDVPSLRLNGVPAQLDPAPKVDDHNTKLTVRFSRTALVATLSPGDHVPVLLTGEIGSGCIEATDYVKVKGPHIHHAPIVTAGQVANITWDVEPASNMSLLFSSDDGDTWTEVASNIPNTGSYNWLVPSTVTSSARLMLTALYATDETGPVNDTEYSSSDAFTITSPLGVGNDAPAFSLRIPNPVTGKLATSFSLPSNAAAELAVFDIAGRSVLKREVGGHAGSQSVTLGALPTGVYVVRLSQAGRSLSNRIAVVQ